MMNKIDRNWIAVTERSMIDEKVWTTSGMIDYLDWCKTEIERIKKTGGTAVLFTDTKNRCCVTRPRKEVMVTRYALSPLNESKRLRKKIA